MIISSLQTICKPIFGQFDREEFKKFLRMGLTFTFVIGSYWTLRVLKGSIFHSLVNNDNLPWAKTVSLILLVPIVIGYTKLLDKYARDRVFYLLSAGYALATVTFALLMLSPIGQAAPEIIAARTGLAFWGTQILGYAWYVFVESYGSLLVALFWAIASDTTMPDSAKKGFSLVVAIGQLGGIVGPSLIASLPHEMGKRYAHSFLETDALSIGLTALTILGSILCLRGFFSNTPKELLVSFHGKNEKEEEKEQEPGFLEGLKLLVRHKYLLCIFAVLSFFEIIVTIFDFHFQILAKQHYTGVALSSYLGSYGSYVNIVALVCLLLGVSNITRILGVGIALVMMPIIYAGAIWGFISFESLNFLFWLMVSSKAINYALNGPAVKQLYLPTTHDVRFKSQAWIETFGSRGSKEAGSIFNMTLKPLQSKFGVIAGRAYHVMASAYLGAALIVCWIFVALYLGRTFKKATDEKRVIC
ncbi:MAG TPA: Npt1/Npt2 family nucleotide transporter [Candidatus Babeliales bacterium]|nr:Npt1/Npt2 family nucleotide transporter [Candidatus Babeliales bacterium]